MKTASCTARVLALTLLLATPFAANARPVIITESARIASPEDMYFSYVAIDGDHLLALASSPWLEHYAVLAYQHIGGEWISLGIVTTTPYHGDGYSEPSIELEGSIGAVTINDGTYAAVLEYTNGSWQAHQIALPGAASSGASIHGTSVAFGFHGSAPSSLAIVTKNASGAWAVEEILEGTQGDHDGDYVGPSGISLATNEASMAGDHFDFASGEFGGLETNVFDRINGQWVKSQTLPSSYSSAVVDDRIALFMARQAEPNDVGSFYTRDAHGAWTNRHSLLTEEFAFDHYPYRPLFTATKAFAGADMLGFGSAGTVFRRDSAGRFVHAATLVPSDVLGGRDYTPEGYRSFSPARPAASATRAAGIWRNANELGAIYIFDIPAELPSPLVREDTFEDGSAHDWATQGPADFRIIRTDGSYVYRQQSVTGDARAIWSGSDATNQSIQADMRVRSGAGPGPWAGLIVRYTNPQNFYYLLVNANSIQIRRMVNGVYGPIAQAPFTWTLGRNYNFRLEAIGKRIRAFRNGELVAEAIDDSHSHGAAGVTMWRAATDYDNVIVTSNPNTILSKDRFTQTYGEPTNDWVQQPANAWIHTTVGSATVLRQTAPLGDARAIIGAHAQDQIVSATITPRTFASNSGWAGLIARYIDNQNYYYVVLRNGTRFSLRKMQNGVIHVIDEMPFDVKANSRFSVRLEAIGSTLRMYIDGRLVAEGIDTAFPEGRFGLMTYNAIADFDDLAVMRP